MNVLPTKLPGALIVDPKVFGDARGFFLETYNAKRYVESGIRETFVQDNLSRSKRGVLRGLHIQSPAYQGKLVSVIEGEVFDVAVDIRLGSPTWGQWVGVTLSGENKRQCYVPPGMAHGFVVTSETALFSYKCTNLYDPAGEVTLAWDDPTVGVQWPTEDVLLSDKDKLGLALDKLPLDKLLKYTEGR
jgi:dTDP-4-dehydrorhamnose 3,5-epimerase